MSSNNGMDPMMLELIAQLLNMQGVGEGEGGGRVPTEPKEKPPTSLLAIRELPDVVIKQKHLEKNPECGVCLGTFRVGDDGKELPCRHIFHDMCVIPWLEQHNTCPNCRYELETLDHDYNAFKRRRQQEEEEKSKKSSNSTNTTSSSTNQTRRTNSNNLFSFLGGGGGGDDDEEEEEESKRRTSNVISTMYL